MEARQTSAFSNGLIWFGAAVSIAEMLTGTLLAPLGLTRALLATVLGHAIGCALLFSAGLIGGQTRRSAMETVKISFGQKGALLFSSLNVLQLVGWTAVMIVSGSSAASSIADIGGNWVWSVVIGALIVVWLLIGVRNLEGVNIVTMGALFILTVVLSTVIFRSGAATAASGTLRFGAAVELAAAMPLSWLPLISDYTRFAKRPFAATTASTVAYFLTSSWMYAIGIGAATFAGEGNVAAILVKAGLGAIGLVIVVLATVTTTFLDAYSAGASSESISERFREKPTAIVVCVVGTVLAIFTPITQLEGFLFLIGSVFAPMIAIQIVDYYVLKKDSSGRRTDWLNLALWLVGFIVYRTFMHIDTPVGNTLPTILITVLLCAVANRITGGRKNA